MRASSKTRLLISAETLKMNLRRNRRNHPSQKPRYEKPIFKRGGTRSSSRARGEVERRRSPRVKGPKPRPGWRSKVVIPMDVLSHRRRLVVPADLG
ncbi:hypothetical protein BHE74_00020768 [Ensete ventricosum]|nr:hypothetical protein BHE74_00020768 [Ensete ventricosum]RZS16287.1 hypothetical protein BHM03_00048259 [Ensete ventricosum]